MKERATEGNTRPWIVHYDERVSDTLEYESTLLSQYLERSSRRFPDRTALIFEGYRLTYRQLQLQVDRFASCLMEFGVSKGDRVALVLPNVIPCVVACHAVLKAGGIVVMNNPLYTDRELEYQLDNSGARVLVTLDLLANRMIALRPKTSVRQIVVTSIGDYLPFPKNLLFPLVARKRNLAAKVQSAEGVYFWKSLQKKVRPPFVSPSISSEDIAMLQYTGGTTGISKGVMLTHGNLSRQVQQIAAWFPDFSQDRETLLGALPFFHVFGLTTAMNLSIVMGWTNVLIAKPQPEQLLSAIKRFSPSFAPMVPTMYIGILNHPGIHNTDLSSIKGCFSGSAPLPVEVIREFEEKTGGVIVEGFGLTETSPVTHINPFLEGRRKVGSIGIPIPDTDCRIVDLANDKKVLGKNEVGELQIKGPQVMKGYWSMPDETADVLQDGWLKTGDCGRMDEDGYFYIVDRIKDMIISGGFNVYPREIDEVFYEHPKVKEACAIGIRHPTRGEAIKVFVVPNEGMEVDKRELMEFCKEKLAKYKWPAEIEFRKDLPKSNVGKILRKKLRKNESQT